MTPRRFGRLAGLACLLGLACGAPLVAAQVAHHAAQQPVPMPATVAQQFPTTPPDWYRLLWEAVQHCASQDGPEGAYRRIVWQSRPAPWTAPGYGSRPVLAEWRRPDTIIVAETHAGEAWVVAHELLHHLLQSPATNPHPWAPFAFPCKLMDFQQPRQP